MPIRRKEKPLSPEELKEKILTSSAESWLHSEPLCAFLAQKDGPKLFPLSPSIESGILVLFLLDVADYTTDRVFEIISEWKERYKNLPWTPVISFQQKYIFIKSPKFLERYRNIPYFYKIPIYLDPTGDWYDGFQTKNEPYLLIFKQGNLLYREKILPDFAKKIEITETQFQEILRLEDPGLPLLEVKENNPDLQVDHKTILPNSMIQAGYWAQANQSLVTDDSQAALSFAFQGKSLRLISTTHPQARENSKIQVLIDQKPIPTSCHGTHLHLNDRGLSVLEVNKNTGIYELIRSDENISGTIQLKFLNAHENPAIIYEFRVG